jgi:outer membrane protein OmpA-like peptidoglycan-associated protein
VRAPRAVAGTLAAASLALLSSGCLGQKLLGDVQGTETSLQRAIRDGSKTIGCAPKETAIAEANIKFARDALDMGEYYRGKMHAEIAASYTKLAAAKTDPVKCREGEHVRDLVVRVGDKDGDGYDDKSDKCPDDPEDFDSFEDDDGCPDKDNDGDGVLDAAELRDGRWLNNDKKADKDCRNDPEDKDQFEDEDGCPDPDNDQDTIPDVRDKCPNDPEDMDSFEDEDGCPDPDNDQDKILDKDDKCPNDPEDYDGDQDTDGCPDLKARFDGCSVVISEKVFFKFNKWDIDPRSFELLNDVATVMNMKEILDAGLQFRVEGHTDSKGADKYNKTLSQKRSDAVKNYLVGRGVASDRLQAVGFGEEVPIDTNQTNDGRARNRRVEFNVSNVDCKRANP